MICPHCKQRDSPEIDHDHFLTCEFSSPSQTKRINEFSVLLVSMKTPQELVSLLKNGLSVFYNNSNNQKISSPLSELSTKQSMIGWNQLARGRISKSFTKFMSLHYTANKTKSFSGEGWSKRVINFLLTTHIEAWSSHCNEIHNSSSKTIKSLAHQSLLITVESLFDKGKSLPQHLQKWFPADTNEINELSLQRLKTWICNTKQLIKLNKPTITDNRKITEFFNPFNVNNIPTISNSHRKTPPTTSQEDSVNNNSLHHLQSDSSITTNLPPMKEKENDKQIAYSNQLFNKKKNNSTTPTFNPITDYFGPSPFKEDTSASIRNYKNITITKSGQHHKSIIKNIINKNKKAKVLKKRHKENDQTHQHVTNVIDHAATPPSSLNMSQDCKVAGQYEQSPPMTVPQKIQPTFAITVPYAFSNTNIHYDTHIHGSPTTRARSKPEIAPEEENINEKFINESLNENKETS